MASRRLSSLASKLFVCAAATLLMQLSFSVPAQQRPPQSAGRTLLLPRTIVSGDRATLAVIDSNGRLTPRATVVFSNGDRLTTDATGRALFVAPLNPGVIRGSIAGRPGNASTIILPSSETTVAPVAVTAIPTITSLTDRFEIVGHGFCGDADANQVTISGQTAFVLASSPTALLIMPPADLEPGRASVDLSCGKQNGPALEVVFVALELQADSSPLAPGVHRTLTVHVRGTRDKVQLEARNLAPDVTDLTGGNPAHVSSSGGWDNIAHFEVVGRKSGGFQISIRLSSSAPRPH